MRWNGYSAEILDIFESLMERMGYSVQYLLGNGCREMEVKRLEFGKVRAIIDRRLRGIQKHFTFSTTEAAYFGL